MMQRPNQFNRSSGLLCIAACSLTLFLSGCGGGGGGSDNSSTPSPAPSTKVVLDTTSTVIKGSDGNPLPFNSISNLTACENLLYFFADDGVNGIEPWVYDPATGKARMIISLTQNNESPAESFGFFHNPNSHLTYFVANSIAGNYILYRTDGTSQNTVPVLTNISASGGLFQALGSNTYFAVSKYQTHQYTSFIFKDSGSSSGAQVVNATSISSMVSYGNALYFLAGTSTTGYGMLDQYALLRLAENSSTLEQMTTFGTDRVNSVQVVNNALYVVTGTDTGTQKLYRLDSVTLTWANIGTWSSVGQNQSQSLIIYGGFDGATFVINNIQSGGTTLTPPENLTYVANLLRTTDQKTFDPVASYYTTNTANGIVGGGLGGSASSKNNLIYLAQGSLWGVGATGLPQKLSTVTGVADSNVYYTPPITCLSQFCLVTTSTPSSGGLSNGTPAQWYLTDATVTGTQVGPSVVENQSIPFLFEQTSFQNRFFYIASASPTIEAVKYLVAGPSEKTVTQ